MSPTSGGGDSVGFWGAIAGIGAVALSSLAGLVGIGKSIEKIEARAKAAKEQSDENEKNIQSLQLTAMRVEALEVAMKQVLALFNDEHGNQRIVTTYVCGKKAEACNLVITERIKHMGELFNMRIVDIAERMDGLEKRFMEKQDETLKAVISELRGKK